MRKKNSILIISFLIFLSSCTKELYFNIKGTITDKSLNANLKDCRLVLKKVDPSGSILEEPLFDFVLSDGKYDISFKRDKALKYILTIEKENYFTISDEIYFDKLSAKDPNIKNYETYAKAWVKFHTKNTFIANPSDIFTFYFLEKVGNCDECCQEDKVTITGAVENIFYCLYEGGKNYKLRYTVSSPFEQTDFYISPVAFDTITFYKEY
jgi:hypothetical protein